MELRFGLKNGRLHLYSASVKLNTRSTKKEQEKHTGVVIQYRLDVSKRK